MTADFEIPPELRCSKCGQPYRVVRREKEAAGLGLTFRKGEILSIECCDEQLRIDDDKLANEVIKLLESYCALAEALGPQ